MKILWTYLQPYRWLILLSLALAGAAQLLSLVDPIIFGKIIDGYAFNRSVRHRGELVSGVLRLLALAVSIALLSRFARAMQDYVVNLVVAEVRRADLQRRHPADPSPVVPGVHDQRSGETLSILQSVRTDTERFINAFINILFSSLVGVGFLVWYAVTKSWTLVPVFLIGILGARRTTGLLSNRIKTLQRSIKRETNRMSGVITESLRNIELVKSLGLTFQEIRRLRAHTQEIFDLELAKVRKVRTLTLPPGLALTLLRQSILFILLWLIFRKILAPGELIAMQFITAQIFMPLQDLGNILMLYREADASLQTYDALMHRPIETNPESRSKPDRSRTSASITWSFATATRRTNAIDDISLEARAGDTIAFVGPSGSGKSTLVKLLSGSTSRSTGEIYYNGISTRDIRFNPVRRQFGFVTQETQLFSGTLRENLLFVKPDATDAEMLDAMEKASAMGIVHAHAAGAGRHHRRERDEAVGRRAPAHLDRPRAASRSAAAHLRRGDVGARLADGGRDHGDGEGGVASGERSPSSSRTVCRRSCTRTGSTCWSAGDRGDGGPRSAAGAEGSVLRDVAPADRRAMMTADLSMRARESGSCRGPDRTRHPRG